MTRSPRRELQRNYCFDDEFIFVVVVLPFFVEDVLAKEKGNCIFYMNSFGATSYSYFKEI